DIVGFYRNAGEPAVNSHGFMRTNKGAFVAVDDPGHINTVAEHILPDGTILGCRHDVDQMNTMRGIIVSTNGSIAELDMNGSMENGATPDHRRVVGLYYPDMAAPNHQEGFLIDDGEFRQLHVPGSVATQAWDMNPTGRLGILFRALGLGCTAIPAVQPKPFGPDCDRRGGRAVHAPECARSNACRARTVCRARRRSAAWPPWNRVHWRRTPAVASGGRRCGAGRRRHA